MPYSPTILETTAMTHYSVNKQLLVDIVRQVVSREGDQRSTRGWSARHEGVVRAARGGGLRDKRGWFTRHEGMVRAARWDGL